MATLAVWVNRSQQDVIECLQEENRVLREHLGGERLLLTDAQRRRLAVKARRLSRKALSGIETVVTPAAVEATSIGAGHRRIGAAAQG